MIIQLTGQPSAELVTIAECHAHLRVEPYDNSGTHPDDAMILAMLASAREHCENFLGFALAVQTYQGALDQFPDGAIEFPVSPLVSIQSITAGGVLVDAANYTVDTFGARALPVTVWPTVATDTNTVRILFTAGGGLLPFAARAAMLLTLTHYYDNRSDSTERQAYTLPTGAEALLRPLRIRRGMA